MKSIKIISVLFLALVGSIFAGVLGLNPLLGAAAMQVMQFIPMPVGILGVNAITSNVLKTERGTYAKQMLEMHNKAKAENRFFNDEERKKYDELKEKRDNLDPKINELEERESLEAADAMTFINNKNSENQKQKPYLEEWRDLKSDKIIPVFGREHRISDILSPEQRKLHPGRALRGMLTGDWSNAEAEQRAIATTTSGVTLPAPLAARVIDLARELSIVMQAGIKTVPMSSKTLTIAKIASDPAVNFKTEAESFSDDSSMALAALTLTAYTMGGIVNVSKELISDSPNIDEALFLAIAGAVAKKIDYSILFGGGTSEPTGWDTLTDVQEISAVAGLTDWSDFISAYSKVLTENGKPNGYIISPREWATLEGLTASGSGEYLTPPKSIAALKQMITSQIPLDYAGDSSNKSVAYLGDFTKVILGMRQEIEISMTDAYKWAEHQGSFKFTMRMDSNVEQPKHIVRLMGITA